MAPPHHGRASLDVPSPSSGMGPYGSLGKGYNYMDQKDPRTSSTQSLTPSEEYDEEGERRKLLLVYIHGFMGNDDSFRNFPFHVHRFLRHALKETHVVHTKIYPKYKTYKAIEVARDNFSRWLEPHESPTTDVVLLGHSMGGLLAAEVVLMPTWNERDMRFFQHRILGTVNLDAPLLGLHPGIITSGISSLFRKKPNPANSSEAVGEPGSSSRPSEPLPSDQPAQPVSLSGLTSRLTMDPNFNPSYPNDVRLKERGWWKNVVHFVTKHNSEGLMDAATNHIMSHLEFGSCLMDFSGLKQRYETLRRLEDIDDIKYQGMPHVPPQVRFVQYYTVCHGFPKKPKTPKPEEEEKEEEEEEHKETQPPQDYIAAGSGKSSEPSTPRISIEDHDDTASEQSMELLEPIPKEDPPTPNATHDITGDNVSILSSPDRAEEYHTPETSRPPSPAPAEPIRPPSPVPGKPESISEAQNTTAPADHHETAAQTTTETPASPPAKVQSGRFREHLPDSASFSIEEALQEFERNLPPMPDMPQEPEPPASYDASNKEIRKYVEKETKRRKKDYESALKSYRSAEKSRKKTVDKMRAKLEAEQKAIRGKQEELSNAAANVAEEKGKGESVGGKDHHDLPNDGLQLLPNAEEGSDDLTAVSTKGKGKAVSKSSSISMRRRSSDSLGTTLVGEVLTNSSDGKGKGKEGTEGPPVPPRSAPPTSNSLRLTLSNESTASASKDGRASKERARSPARPPKPEKPAKPPKDRKFCNCPSKVNGEIDSKWVRVFMKDVDEVEAHTGLFFPRAHYESLVGDVGEMIVRWVEYDASKRLIMEG